MVHSNGAITSTTILKARLADDVRKSSLHHANDLTLIDLVLNVQRIFALPSDANFLLKYKDQDGDLISLTSDSDLLLALNTVGATLDVSVVVDTKAREVVQDVQRQVEQIKLDVGKLLGALSSLDNLASLADNSCSQATTIAQQHVPSIPPTSVSATHHHQHDNLDLQKSYEAPPSPVPSEKPELPATIQPSVQEQFNHRPSIPAEEEIPLESSFHAPPPVDSLNSSFSQPPPIEQFGAMPPPNATIPSFPTSNAAMPPIQQEPVQQQFGAPPPAPFQPPQHSHSSVSSTPQNFGAPPQGPPGQFGGPPPSGPPSEYGGYAPQGPPQGQFGAPPQGPPQGQFGAPSPAPQGPPQGQFGAPPQGPPQGQFGASSPAPQAPGQFGPPQGQFGAPQGPPQGHFAPPPPPVTSQAPGNFAPPPPGAPGATPFAPPPSGFGGMPPSQGPPQGPPGQFGGPGGPPPPGAFAPPPSQFGGPPQGPPQGAFPPVGAPGGAPGGNPFARGPAGPGYRQSPYHQ
ncbi:Protein CBR-TFG-1 [Caenorhabditis briggsae]|uniref:Protein CBR-TFG-1 n=2 Tax=Caenorhabditis briggsae TaxID=6238 RepID=A8XU67_CAEBR|nr:Protein CBR-TFG-1 [Caenorhabditis briggsae]ULU13815.1 hypothetical protein L3Y34_016366 [Caenorhabditis briggsae]CAP36192.2 Protein CBR-TFG-1 [Caenorhabditis briggsae]